MEQGRVTRADDLEMGTEPLLQSEVAHYVKAYPLKPEHIDISTLLSFEYNKKGQRIVFVENSLTHELMREFINDSQFQCDKETLTSDKYDEFDPLLSSDRSMVKKISPFVVNFSEAVSNYLRTFYLFIQGILAGFSFTTLYFVAAASPTTNITLFLRIYSPLAGEIRRYFFLLSSIALLGSIDTFLTTFQHSSNSKSKLLKSIQPKNASGQPNQEEDEEQGQNIMSTFIVALLYFICFIATLQMSVDDTLISVDPVITQLDLTNWSQLNSVRYITTFLAWIGVCMINFYDLYEKRSLEKNVHRLKELCRQWCNKVEDLSGEGTRLAAMGGPELQLLIRAQKRGVERTTVALKELTILHE